MPASRASRGCATSGTKVGFASLGPEVAIGAPGGNCVNVTGGPCLFSIDTTSNAGTTTPGAFTYTNQTNVNVGTSFSAPIVSGIVGLMAGANGNLGSAQLLARLREGATTPFPVSPDPAIPMCHVPANQNDLQTGECNCTTSTCGAGMANARRRVGRRAAPDRRAVGAAERARGAERESHRRRQRRRVQSHDQHVFLASRERRGRAHGPEQHGEHVGQRPRDGLVHRASER